MNLSRSTLRLHVLTATLWGSLAGLCLLGALVVPAALTLGDARFTPDAFLALIAFGGAVVLGVSLVLGSAVAARVLRAHTGIASRRGDMVMVTLTGWILSIIVLALLGPVAGLLAASLAPGLLAVAMTYLPAPAAPE